MKCHDVEKLLLNHQISEEAEKHIENCSRCQLYKNLISTEIIKSNHTVNMDLIVSAGLEKKRKMDFISFIGFVSILFTILFSIYKFGNINYYLMLQGTLTLIMPFVLLVITVRKRKETKHE